MKKLFYLIVIISSVYISKAALVGADKSGLTGYVRDSETGETLVGATVFIEGTKLGARTDKNGYFTVRNMPPGMQVFRVSYLGYETLTDSLDFPAGQTVRRDFELKPGSVQTEEISVIADRDVEKRQISVSKVNIPVETIKKIRIGGESDVFRTLQYLPGVLTSSQISSGLFVRGGSPDQNLVLLDGSTVYNPTHLFGFISTFNSEAIKDVELVKGGFDAEYGGRMSAVLNITQKDGNRKDFGGNASIGAISSRLGLEGPVGNGSWFISGRRTYFELIKAIAPEDPDQPIPDFNFYDINGKISQDFGPNDKVSISGFFSRDNLAFSNFGLGLDLEVGNRMLAGRWIHIFNEDLFLTTNMSYSSYFNNFGGSQSGYDFLIDNEISDLTLKSNLEWFISDALTTKFGFQVSDFTFDYLQNFTGDTDSTAEGSQGGSTNFTINDLHSSAYGQFKWAIDDLFSVQAGLRAMYWEQAGMLNYDPRISARYYLTDKISLKAAWGQFHQNLRLATQPDFSFFDTWLPTDSTVPASKSTHYIFTVETRPWEGYLLNFDAYYKTFDNVSELNTTALETDNVADVFFIGNAEAYGAEVFLQKSFGRFTGWLGYAVGFIEAKFDSVNNGAPFRPKYDRTHDFKIVAQYDLNEKWDLGATFIFQSGQSYTGATSRFQTVLPGQTYGRGKIVPSQRYGLRLPPSHQLNINASYSFKTWGLDSKVVLDVFNVYNRKDIWFRFYNTQEDETFVEDITLLPILPTISYEIKF
jgi:outer membrane cobalamin receptor